MSKIYNTAQGQRVNIDNIILQNEHIIAVGNQKVNAGGDILGPGGTVVKTRDQAMQEYYSLKTPIADDGAVNHQAVIADALTKKQSETTIPVVNEQVDLAGSGIEETDMEVEEKPRMPVPPTEKEMRGSLANTLSQGKNTTVAQTEHLPPKKANGIQRF